MLSRLVDDGPAIAEIIQAPAGFCHFVLLQIPSAFVKMAQEGFRLCQRKPPAEFLKVSESKRNSSQALWAGSGGLVGCCE